MELLAKSESCTNFIHCFFPFLSLSFSRKILTLLFLDARFCASFTFKICLNSSERKKILKTISALLSFCHTHVCIATMLSGGNIIHCCFKIKKNLPLLYKLLFSLPLKMHFIHTCCVTKIYRYILDETMCKSMSELKSFQCFFFLPFL